MAVVMAMLRREREMNQSLLLENGQLRADNHKGNEQILKVNEDLGDQLAQEREPERRSTTTRKKTPPK